MELIDQHTKGIMEGCKERARAAGLNFFDESLEYIVTNRDLLELSPKAMIPTLYDYWVNDVEILKEKGRYELYPHNPYETVINTHPAISFYNDNNPDWLNVMIFYHVLAHIDFFQNNMLFKHTWDDDFTGQALADKRLINMLRSEKGRWVDYIIEFTRGIDNLVGFYRHLSDLNKPAETSSSSRVDFYFDTFLQKIRKIRPNEYLNEIDRYNATVKEYGEVAESVFFSDIVRKHPEFETLFEKQKNRLADIPKDLIEFIQTNSKFLNREENIWMKSVVQIVRNTSIFFQPQIRTKIMNEGWASYWHEKLFLMDDRIKGHEVGFATVNAKVTALPRAGINPYALGMRMFDYIEELANKGKLSYEFQRLNNRKKRESFDANTNKGRDYIFEVRENFSDFMFINSFVEQDFTDRHRLFVLGKRVNNEKGVIEYYVKSRSAFEYKKMLLDSLYHPPDIKVEEDKTDSVLYLNHTFEGKPLVKDFIKNTMIGIEYLWGGAVKLETTEKLKKQPEKHPSAYYYFPPLHKLKEPDKKKGSDYQRVLYTMENRILKREVLI